MDPRIIPLVTELLAKMGVATDAVVASGEAEHPLVSVTSPDSKRLIGSQGEHLNALNQVARKMAEHMFGEDTAHFLIDVNGYHQERIDSIKKRAAMLAERVRSLRSRTPLPPLNSYERMIVHSMFADDPEIGTQSEGEGRDRHVVLFYRDPQSASEFSL